MSLLKNISDKGAVLEWSPIVNQSNMVAIGTKVSVQNHFIILNYFDQKLQ